MTNRRRPMSTREGSGGRPGVRTVEPQDSDGSAVQREFYGDESSPLIDTDLAYYVEVAVELGIIPPVQDQPEVAAPTAEPLVAETPALVWIPTAAAADEAVAAGIARRTGEGKRRQHVRWDAGRLRDWWSDTHG